MKKIIFILLCLVSFNAIADGYFNLSIGHWFGSNSIFFNYHREYQDRDQYWNRPYYQPYDREYYPRQYEWNRQPVIIYKYNYRNYWRRNDDKDHQHCIVKYHTYFFNRFTGRYTFETHYIDRCNHGHRDR